MPCSTARRSSRSTKRGESLRNEKGPGSSGALSSSGMVPEARVELARLSTTVFETATSAIPSLGRNRGLYRKLIRRANATSEYRRHLRFVDHADACIVEHLRRHAPAIRQGAGKRSVVDAPTAARGAFRFEDGKLAAALLSAAERLCAPATNAAVLSAPLESTTCRVGSDATISLGRRGMGSLPSDSGQMGTKVCSLASAITASHGRASPSKRHAFPNKHALTAMFIRTSLKFL